MSGGRGTLLDRRELLTLLVGAPLALEACRRPSPREVPGRVVGGALELGHLLREAKRPADAPPTRELEVAIIGGGIAGLVAGRRLLEHGITDFELFELEPRAGGTASYGTDGVVPYPWAAHYVPAPQEPNSPLGQLLFEMGALETDAQGRRVPREDVLVRAPEERLFVGGRWIEGGVPHPVMNADDRRQLARFEALVAHWVGVRDSEGRRAFTLPVAECSQSSELYALDRESAADFLRRHGLHSRPLRVMLEYACRDDYGTELSTTSAWALLFYHAARVQAPGQPSSPYLTWPEGNGRIVRHLTGQLGARTRLGALVMDVVPSDEEVRLVVLSARERRVEHLRAKAAILAVPTFLRRHLVRPFRESPPDYLGVFSYAPWLVANLHLSGRPKSRGVPLAWDNVIFGGASLGYVTATHQMHEDDGPTIFTYYQPFSDAEPKRARERLEAAHHRGATEAVFAELLPAHPDLGLHLERLDVFRFGHAMVRPTVGMFSDPRRRAAALPLGRLHFANTDLSGVALLEEAFFHGWRAADAVVEQLRPAPQRGELGVTEPRETTLDGDRAPIDAQPAPPELARGDQRGA